MKEAYTIITYIYLFVLFVCSICSFYRYRSLDIASKIFAFFIAFSFAVEVIAFLFAVTYGNNMSVYTLYSPIEFLIISIYFNYTIDIFQRKKIGFFIGAFGVFFGLINVLFIQGVRVLNTYFLIFEGIGIIILGLIFFLRLYFKNEPFHILNYHHFWFAAILVFFWAISFTKWSLYNYFLLTDKDFLTILSTVALIFVILIYVAIAAVFILMPKLQRSDASN